MAYLERCEWHVVAAYRRALIAVYCCCCCFRDCRWRLPVVHYQTTVCKHCFTGIASIHMGARTAVHHHQCSLSVHYHIMKMQVLVSHETLPARLRAN
eukprot:1340-Heterococcus_DN1.PRE.4